LRLHHFDIARHARGKSIARLLQFLVCQTHRVLCRLQLPIGGAQVQIGGAHFVLDAGTEVIQLRAAARQHAVGFQQFTA